MFKSTIFNPGFNPRAQFYDGQSGNIRTQKSKYNEPGATSIKFTRHQVIMTATAKQFMDTADNGSCDICHKKLHLNKSGDSCFSVVSCVQILHNKCLKTWLKDQSATWLQENQDKADQLELLYNARNYANIKELYKELPVKCGRTLCTARDTYTAMNKRVDCPYPLIKLNWQGCNNFLAINSEVILDTIKTEFETTGFKNIVLSYSENTVFSSQSPATGTINVTACDPGEGTTAKNDYYYTSASINKGDSIRACFSNIMEDLGADLTMRHFQLKNPGAFNPGTEIYIKYYDTELNQLVITIKERLHTLEFSSVFDPLSRTFNEKNFKEALEKIGASYDDLLDNTEKPINNFVFKQSKVFEHRNYTYETSSGEDSTG